MLVDVIFPALGSSSDIEKEVIADARVIGFFQMGMSYP